MKNVLICKRFYKVEPGKDAVSLDDSADCLKSRPLLPCKTPTPIYTG